MYGFCTYQNIHRAKHTDMNSPPNTTITKTYYMKYGLTDKMRETNECNHFMGAIFWFEALALLIDHSVD